MSSDVIFARREARRRKILQNSENRLRSITGESHGIKSNSESGLCGNEGITHNEDFFESNSYGSSSPLKVEGNNSSESLSYGRLQNITESVEVSENNDVATVNIYNKNKISYIIYVAVAILLKILTETNNSNIFGNSLVGAFIVSKVIVNSVSGWQTPATSRIMGSFLLISGISSQKTNLIVFATSIFLNLVKDFAVLIFVFVFLELFITSSRHLI